MDGTPSVVRLTKEELLFLADTIDRDFLSVEDQDRADALVERLARGWFGQSLGQLRAGE